jgi:hypothetical protein
MSTSDKLFSFFRHTRAFTATADCHQVRSCHICWSGTLQLAIRLRKHCTSLSEVTTHQSYRRFGGLLCHRLGLTTREVAGAPLMIRRCPFPRHCSHSLPRSRPEALQGSQGIGNFSFNEKILWIETQEGIAPFGLGA